MKPLAAILVLSLTAGCYVAARPAYGPGEIVVTPAPVRVETYPYVFYDGGPVYWVEGRWYRRYGNGWIYYQREPAFLYQRRPGVTTAPPAYPQQRGPAPPATIQAPPAR